MLIVRTFSTEVDIFSFEPEIGLLRKTAKKVPIGISIEVGNPNLDWARLMDGDKDDVFIRISMPDEGEILNGWIKMTDLGADVLYREICWIPSDSVIDEIMIHKKEVQQALDLYLGVSKDQEVSDEARLILAQVRKWLISNS